MPSKAKGRFDQNKKDIDELWGIHQAVAGEGVGRKHGVDVLNRAAIVFVTACWESFVEDLATEAFDFMLAKVPSADRIPAKVRDHATKPLFDQKDSRKLWDLADAGWRAVLTAHRNATLERWLGHFHTPKTEQVDALYEALLDIAKLSQRWRWQSMSPDQASWKIGDPPRPPQSDRAWMTNGFATTGGRLPRPRKRFGSTLLGAARSPTERAVAGGGASAVAERQGVGQSG
jgi:hypothetical protein